MTVTEKRLAKRRRITEEAARLFGERGYQATRMADVAAALGMQAGSLYYYVDSKEALLAAIVEERVSVAVDMLTEILVEDLDPVAKIRRGIEGHLVVFDEHADLYRIFLSERLDAIAPELAATVDRLGRRYEDLWVDLVNEAIAAGALRPDLDPWLTMKAIVGMRNSTLFWFDPAGRLTPEEVADRFADVVLGGMET
ncbi:MAG: TetR/AcrR family transcriptional regulator [Acidimicrobiia bacterium]